MNAGLSYAASPPLALPLRWFLSVPVFGALAGGWLLWAGPAVMAGRWQPQALAYVHLLALGVLLSAMLGALIQLLPVLVGAPLRRAAPIAAGVQALLLPGIVLFAGGLGTGAAPLVRFGSALLLCALLVYAAAALPAWWRSPRSGESARTIGWAGLSFLIAAALGFTLAAGHGWAGVPLLRRLTDLHAGWALIGWVGLLVAAVAWQVVPMFSITAPYPLWLRTGLAPVSVAALGLASLDAGWPLPDWLGHAAALAAGAALLGFAACTLWLQHRRRRRLPDPWLGYWKLALGCAALAVCLWLAGRFGLRTGSGGSGSSTEMLSGLLWLLGFGTTLVAGMLQRIVAFLVWLDLSTRLSAVRSAALAPNVRELIPAAALQRQFAAQFLSVGLTLAACTLPALARPAGAAGVLAWGLLALNLVRAIRTGRGWRQRIGDGRAAVAEQSVTI